MSFKYCCVPGCTSKGKDVPLHCFPNPSKELDRFKLWLFNCGADFEGKDEAFIFTNRRICRLHFEKKYHYPKNRLCKIAVPTLFGQDKENENLNQNLTTTLVPNVGECSMTSAISADSFHATSMLTDKMQEHVSSSQCTRTINNKEAELIKSVQNLKAKMRSLKHKNLKMKERLHIAKDFAKTRQFEVMSGTMTKAAKLFFQIQISQGKKKVKGRRFTLKEKMLALSLYKSSPKGYRLLSNICILPKRKTLQDLLRKIRIKPGINKEIFEHLRKKVSKMPKHHRYCCVIFDEMAISAEIKYDSNNDIITGFVDDGTHRSKQFCDHVLVFMVRGVVKKYKQPIAFTYCAGTTKTLCLKNQIKVIIEEVEKTGLEVIASICDQGATNLSAINSLSNNTKEQFLRRGEEYKGGFFEVCGKKVYPVYDPPHLLKGIRNNLITKNLKYVTNGKTSIAKWTHITALFNRAPGYKGVQSLFFLGCGTLPKECEETADLLLFLDKLFDSVNGSYSEVQRGKFLRAAVKPKSPHHKFWLEALSIFKTMKFLDAGREKVVPSISNWIKTIEAFQQIVKILHSRGQTSINMRNFNQDPLENFFGSIRSLGTCNRMPSAYVFEGNYKTLLVNNVGTVHSVGANCENDYTSRLQSLRYFFSKSLHYQNNAQTDFSEGDTIIEYLDTDLLLQNKSPNAIEKCAAAGYCSGWFLKTAKKFIFKNCKMCSENLECKEEQPFHSFIKIKEYEQKNWLCYPSRPIFNMFLNLEHIVYTILEEKCTTYSLKEYIKLIVTINMNFDFIKCEHHKERLANFIRDKAIDFFIHNWCKEINRMLRGKLPPPNLSQNNLLKSAHDYFVKHKCKK